jgi:acyl carrier protein phosphodiesterase
MLESWIQSTYSLLQKRQAEMTDKRRFIAEKMIEHDWMNMYKTEEGTSRILNQMSMRIPFANPLKDSFQIYRMHEKDIISTFHDFFPQILWATQDKLDTFAP